MRGNTWCLRLLRRMVCTIPHPRSHCSSHFPALSSTQIKVGNSCGTFFPFHLQLSRLQSFWESLPSISIRIFSFIVRLPLLCCFSSPVSTLQLRALVDTSIVPLSLLVCRPSISIRGRPPVSYSSDGVPLFHPLVNPHPPDSVTVSNLLEKWRSERATLIEERRSQRQSGEPPPQYQHKTSRSFRKTSATEAGPAQPPEAAIFATPRNAEFYSKHRYQNLDPKR